METHPQHDGKVAEVDNVKSFGDHEEDRAEDCWTVARSHQHQRDADRDYALTTV